MSPYVRPATVKSLPIVRTMKKLAIAVNPAATYVPPMSAACGFLRPTALTKRMPMIEAMMPAPAM